MSYKISRKHPYKKASFLKSITKKISSVFLFGTVVLFSAKLNQDYQKHETEKQYDDAISNYEQMVEETAQFLKEKNYTVEECFQIYTKLLWEGYFSTNWTYRYQENENQKFTGYYGMQIATGIGDCKNNEDLFYKIMTQLGYETYSIVTIDPTSNNFWDWIFGNHVITVIKVDSTYYYLDTTNMCCYQNKGIHLENGNQEIIIHPIASYLYGEYSVKEIFQFFNDIQKNSATQISTNTDSIEEAMVLRKRIEPYIQKMNQSLEEF